MQELFQDMRHALRLLSKAPGFTVTVLLTLALGIGATTAIFTLVYDVMLRPLPFKHADRLVVLEEQVAEFRDIYPKLPVTANHFVNWERNSHSFEAMTAIEQNSVPMGTDGHPIQVKVVRATPGIFSVLNATPQIGRPFTAQEAQAGRDGVVVLMNDLWRTQFQSDPAILGKTITLSGYPYTVIGVMPASFHLPVMQDLANNTDRAKPVEALLPQVFPPGSAGGTDARLQLLRARPAQTRRDRRAGQRGDQCVAALHLRFAACERKGHSIRVADALSGSASGRQSNSVAHPAGCGSWAVGGRVHQYRESSFVSCGGPPATNGDRRGSGRKAGRAAAHDDARAHAAGRARRSAGLAVGGGFGAGNANFPSSRAGLPWNSPSGLGGRWVCPCPGRLGQLCWQARLRRGSDRERSRWRCCVASRARRANRAAASACAERWWL